MGVGGTGVVAGAALVVGATVVEVGSVVGGGLAGLPGLDCSPESTVWEGTVSAIGGSAGSVGSGATSGPPAAATPGIGGTARLWPGRMRLGLPG